MDASHSFDRIKLPAAFWSGFRSLGLAASDVVRKAQLPLTLLTEPGGVTTAQYFAIWQAVSELIDDPAAGMITLMTEAEPAQWPPSLLAPYHARDYRDALNRMARYKQLCSPERLRLTEGGEQCTIELEWLSTDQSEPPMLVYIAFAGVLDLGRRGTRQPLTARSVDLSSSMPMGNEQALEQYFGCGVQFGAPHNRLTLHRRDLDRSFVSYNAELLEILIPALDHSLDEQQRSTSLTQMVKWMVKRTLDRGRPDIQAIANEIGMSERTLQRRLTDEGTSFKHLLTEARREKAREYLTDPSLDLNEVAFLLGYEDQNSFYRAFRQWEGNTPSHWRAEQRVEH